MIRCQLAMACTKGHAPAPVWVAGGEARACPHDDARTSAWPWRNRCHAEFPEITADYVGAFGLNDYTAQTGDSW